MSMPLTLGTRPGKLALALTAGTDFAGVVRYQDRDGEPVDWPEGTQLRLVLSRDGFTRSWDWTVDGEYARLTIPAADVDELPVYSLHAQLLLNYGAGDLLWCSGTVERHA